MAKKFRRVYRCMKCNGPVSKPPCVAPPAPEKNVKGQTVVNKIEYHGLHGWRCDNCGVCKVTLKLEEMK